MLTTSSFTREAVEYAAQLDSGIVLIDGARLADLIYGYGIGVTTRMTYELRRLELDYFEG